MEFTPLCLLCRSQVRTQDNPAWQDHSRASQSETRIPSVELPLEAAWSAARVKWHRWWPVNVKFKENNFTKAFCGDLMKTFSHKVNNGSNKKLWGVGTGEKKCMGQLESAGVDERAQGRSCQEAWVSLNRGNGWAEEWDLHISSEQPLGTRGAPMNSHNLMPWSTQSPDPGD